MTTFHELSNEQLAGIEGGQTTTSPSAGLLFVLLLVYQISVNAAVAAGELSDAADSASDAARIGSLTGLLLF